MISRTTRTTERICHCRTQQKFKNSQAGSQNGSASLSQNEHLSRTNKHPGPAKISWIADHEFRGCHEPSTYQLSYVLWEDLVTISVAASDPKSASTQAASSTPASFVIPSVSPSGETVRQVSEHRIEIDKPDGTVVVQCNVPLTIKDSEKGRIFNMVPAAETVAIIAEFPAEEVTKLQCEISVKEGSS